MPLCQVDFVHIIDFNRFMLFNIIMSKRIVITGAPGSGKTEFLKRLSNEDIFKNFVFFEEMARKLLDETPDYRNRWSDFHHEIYKQQIERENRLEGKPFVTDRGTVDAFAFHPETAEQVGTSIEKEYDRYDIVVQLGSAAALGDNFYRKDKIRFESLSEALDIEYRIKKVWKNHPGYHFIQAHDNLEKKYERFLEYLKKSINGI